MILVFQLFFFFHLIAKATFQIFSSNICYISTVWNKGNMSVLANNDTSGLRSCMHIDTDCVFPGRSVCSSWSSSDYHRAWETVSACAFGEMGGDVYLRYFTEWMKVNLLLTIFKEKKYYSKTAKKKLIGDS